MAVTKSIHRVLFGDTDALGIVYYGNYLRYFEIGRAEWFREFVRPFTYYIEQDYYLVVVDTYIKYIRPARYDDLIEIQSRVTNVKKASFRFEYQIFNQADGQTLAEGYTSHTVTGKDGRIRKFSREFLGEIERLAEPAIIKPRKF